MHILESLYDGGSESVVLELAASALPGNLLEMQILHGSAHTHGIRGGIWQCVFEHTILGILVHTIVCDLSPQGIYVNAALLVSMHAIVGFIRQHQSFQRSFAHSCSHQHESLPSPIRIMYTCSKTLNNILKPPYGQGVIFGNNDLQ
jgi:hypothetical protein